MLAFKTAKLVKKSNVVNVGFRRASSDEETPLPGEYATRDKPKKLN